MSHVGGGGPSPEYLEAVERAVRIIARRFVFGYYSLDDAEQECRLLALQAWPRYDRSREPGPFVYRHVLNRMRNVYRDRCHRNDPPCKDCHRGVGHDGEGGPACAAYVAWSRLNGAKASLMSPTDIETIPRDMEDYLARDEESPANEYEGLDELLPVEVRADFLRMVSGVRLTKSRRARVEAAVLEVFDAAKD